MPRATCRCGQALIVPDDGTDRIVCPECGAKVRVRLPAAREPAASVEGGFLRFDCPCGRRLKVKAEGGPSRPSHGKCPDCGRVVPVPATGLPGRDDPESPTEEISAADVAMLDEWTRRHAGGDVARAPSSTHPMPAIPKASPWTGEAGLRICPGCGKPVHLGASICRDCGTSVPKR